MNPVAKQFNKEGYVYLENALPKNECDAITKYLFGLCTKGTLTKDEQCPLSDSIYDDILLNAVLKKLVTPLSQQLEIDLDPSYCYARIYRPGEVLERHKDREACEISGTLTLGFDQDNCVWPIFFGKDENDLLGTSINIDVGDIVIYKGEELPHWRNEFKGTWQTQVFFHFVDKNGKNKEHAFDQKRKQVESTVENTFNPKRNIIDNVLGIRTCDDVFPGVSTFHSKNQPDLCFTDVECDKIIDLHNKLYEIKGTVGSGDTEGTFSEETRTVDVYDLPFDKDNKWIFDKIMYAAAKANKEYYNFNLLGITHSLQLLHYKPGGHYDWHIDAGHGSSATRKLSVVIPLSNKTEYEGGNLKLNNNGNELSVIPERGSITTFPSFCLHKVEPVTSGERWSLVIWIHGPDRFK
jgi:PKHD-type hydroxylase